jgi:hypothetical protein
MRHIFISHAARDRQHMLKLRENLLYVGYRPWVDPQPGPGQDWRFAIDDAIRAADALVVIVTPAAAESVYVTYEWATALSRGVTVIPVIFKTADMHPRLQTLEHFDMTAFRDEEQFWDYFTRELRRRLDVPPRPDMVQPEQPLPENPPRREPQQPPAYTRTVMPQQPGYYLVVRRGPRLNQMFKLEKEIVSLGRGKKNDITIDDPEISRHHLRLMREDDGYSVDDLDSTNGTRLNGGPRIEGVVPLEAGQTLMLGDAIILSYEVIS